MARTNIRGTQIADASVDMAVDVIGTLPIANGGTGATTAAGARSGLGAAPLSSPAFTDTPTTPTAAAGTNTTQIASTAFAIADRIAAAGVVNVKDHGAIGNGSTDDTSAIATAYAATSGKALYFPPGTYLVTALPAFVNRDAVIGAGPTQSMIKYTGTGTLKQCSDLYGMTFRNIGFWGTGAGATLLRLSNCFRFSFDHVIFRGAHDDASGATYRTQVGLKLDTNTGASFISHCDFENLGIGLQTSCIQNQVTLSKFTVCYRSVYGVGGTANAGLSLSYTEFVGGDVGTTETHVYIDGSANCWTLFGVWFEKADYACRVGVGGTGGPSQWTMIGCKIGAKTTGVDLIYCRQPLLINCEWDLDQGGTQTELVINATNAEEGTAIGLVTTLRADFDDADFPQYWTVARKGALRGGNVSASSGLTTVNFKMTGGSPGAGKVLTSDADGDASWTAAGSGDALVANPLSQFAATTSAQLAGVITNETGSGALVFGTTPTIATPVLNGLPTGTGVATAATVSTLALRDANGNLSAVNLLEGYTTTATAAGTTTLTVASNYLQFFTGSTTQTVTMPVASTLVLGQQWLIVNLSTGNVTVQSSGSNSIVVLAGSTSAVLTCILASGTSAASWNASYNGDVVTSGKKLSVSNSLTLAGTDGTTMTFPGTSDTVVTLAAAQTMTSKRITKRSLSSNNDTTFDIDTDLYDYAEDTGLTGGVTVTTSGTPTAGQTLWFSLTGTASRAVTMSATYFEASTVAIPTTTSGTARLDIGCVWNPATSRWRVVAVA